MIATARISRLSLSNLLSTRMLIKRNENKIIPTIPRIFCWNGFIRYHIRGRLNPEYEELCASSSWITLPTRPHEICQHWDLIRQRFVTVIRYLIFPIPKEIPLYVPVKFTDEPVELLDRHDGNSFIEPNVLFYEGDEEGTWFSEETSMMPGLFSIPYHTANQSKSYCTDRYDIFIKEHIRKVKVCTISAFQL